MSLYLEKLRDPRWQKMRLKILERDEWSCQICSDTKNTLHVHHKFYVSGKEPWDYETTALVTLCELCHQDETQSGRQEEKMLLMVLKSGGAMSTELNGLAVALYPLTVMPLVNHEWELLYWLIRQWLKEREQGSEKWEKLETIFWRAAHEKTVAYMSKIEKCPQD